MTDTTNLFEDSQLMIFDLDGTLYEDTDHFAYYAHLLKQEVDEAFRSAYEREYKKMINGEHTLKIGSVYDLVRDHIVEIDSSSSRVTHAWTWDGDPLSEDERQRLYPTPVECDFETMMAIGDGWWLPNACARHFGVNDTDTAYVKTKEYMAAEQFSLTRIPGLREGLLHLKQKRDIVLVTNSDPDDVGRLLDRLDLDDIFEDRVTVAKKPQYTKNHFSQLLKEYDVRPHEAISIGDNYINEIAPAIQLGLKTIFIDAYNSNYPEYKGVKVDSISETIEDMLEL
ncbi:HAD family hydrolase [Caldalkalibacillus salinus]|uniref:HAD family hydrolase n=1 Tax=Caldalkalibacillus salinus TaxID=2803787 RepID=UPI001920ED2A|nr:HAD family hydrolase [Caldalkalibacillus salinus]